MGEDCLFLPHYKNRAAAARVFAGRDRIKDGYRPANKKDDLQLSHTAICMRLILSEGRVNIFTLAKNAGTSVNQIERFYARNLRFRRSR
jgi:hypothetical protein